MLAASPSRRIHFTPGFRATWYWALSRFHQARFAMGQTSALTSFLLHFNDLDSQQLALRRVISGTPPVEADELFARIRPYTSSALVPARILDRTNPVDDWRTLARRVLTGILTRGSLIHLRCRTLFSA